MQYQVISDSLEINKDNVKDWLQDFTTNILPNRQKMGAYYDGLNEISKQGAVKGRPNYSINVNMAKYIIDVATGYVFGNPVKYDTKSEKAKNILEKIKYIHKNCNIQELDFQQGGDMSTYGVSYQLLMALGDKKGAIEDKITIKSLNPEQTFYVVDNSIMEVPICAIFFYGFQEKNVSKTKIYVYDKDNLSIFEEAGGVMNFIGIEPHFMGQIPIIQCLNNDDAFSDIQCITDLLDSLSLAVSNTTDNLQSIANAILSVSGAKLANEEIKALNEYKVANMPTGSKMEWVIKNINPEAEKMQIDNLLNFIFQISQVPDLTDDAFAGNQSGVAMQYKLWGLDQLWATKTTKYKKAITQRLTILMHLLQYQFKSTVQMLDEINITFDKNLPRDNSAEYTMIQTLKDVVSLKTLLSNVSIVDDVEEEIKALEEEKAKEVDLYGYNNNGGVNVESEQ